MYSTFKPLRLSVMGAFWNISTSRNRAGSPFGLPDPPVMRGPDCGLLIRGANNKPFVERGQLRMVLTVLIPTAIYAALVTWIGIYTASVLFIAFFMIWLGKYAWWTAVVVSVATMVFFYMVFEIWFKVPLPKGFVERLLGLD